jgi:hypothetical protein
MSTLLAIVAIALLLLIGFATLGCSGPRGGGGKTQVTGPPVVLSAEQVEVLDREAIRALLRRVAEAQPPKNLSMGAMCYSIAPPPQRADYLCPTCGGRTLYEKGLARLVEWELQEARREFEELKKVTGTAISFDESQFCRECKPDVRRPQLVLKVTYQDGRQVTVSPVEPGDLRLLREFLSGKLVCTTGNDGEIPMKNVIPRLEELLGVSPR